MLQINNAPPNIAGIVLNNVTVKVGQSWSFVVDAPDELPFNLLDITQHHEAILSFITTSKNSVTISPSFNLEDSIWIARLLISDGVNAAVSLPKF